MKLFQPLFACVVALSCAAPTNGIGLLWINSGNGVWSNPNNWFGGFPAVAPGNNDSAHFGSDGSPIVSFNAAPAAIQALTVQSGFGTGPVTFESNGGPFTLNVNSATGSQDVLLNFRSLTLGTSGKPLNLVAGHDISINGATLSVLHGSDVNVSTGDVDIGPGGSGGSLNIEGASSSMVQAGAGAVVVGSATGSTAAVNIGTVTSGALLDTGGGGLVINSTGVVTVGSASGASTGTLIISNLLNVAGGDYILNPGSSVSYSTAGISVNLGGSFTSDGLTTATAPLDVSGGGSVVLRKALAANGPVTIDGAGSSLITNTVDSTVSGASGSIIVRNGATASFAAGLNCSGALLQIQSGAEVTTGDFQVWGIGGTGVTIVGAGSSLSLGPGRTLTIGQNSSTPGPTVKVLDAAELNFAGGGTTKINLDGTLTIDGGSAYLNFIDMQGGKLDFVRGSLSYAGDLTVGNGGLLGTDLNLSNRHLTLSGTTTVEPGRMLVLDGGTLNTGSLVVNGAFHFNAGTLGVTTPGTNLNMPLVTNSPGATIRIFATGVTMGQAGSFNGFHHLGLLHVGNNSVTLNSAGYARLGILTTLAGGTINAANGVVFASGSNLNGYGTVNSRVAGEAGSVIDTSGSLTLGDAASPAGFNFGGELRVRQHTVTLLSSVQATLGNLTSFNVGSSPGTLIATNGVVVDFGDAVTGYGTINSSNTLAKRTIINGVAEGVSPSSRLTFTGYVKGVGTFNNVNFTGTFSPGLSPTILTVGNLAFASTNTVIMELGGSAPGSEYDVIQSTGELAVDGTLTVAVINSFNPQAGNTFNLFDFVSLTGTFDVINLPTLASGLSWNTSNLYTTGVLSIATSAGLPGDFNNDGAVNAADYVVWRKGVGVAPTPANYDLWRTNFGHTSGGGSAADVTGAVPEPHGLALNLIACLGLSVFVSVRGSMRRSL